jgi:UDP-2,4-diacetamido-2,4,6-trideoxy-beta-L-altropyranose hydrolase
MEGVISIRKAKFEDVDILYIWSNDALVRKQSFISDKIPYDSHCEWFKSKLVSKNTIIFIVEFNQDSVGVVRFESNDKNTTVGISIDEKYRGKGFSKKMLNIGVKAYFKENDLPVLASIKKDNIASIKSFEKAGFVLLKEEAINGVESLIYKIEK